MQTQELPQKGKILRVKVRARDGIQGSFASVTGIHWSSNTTHQKVFTLWCESEDGEIEVVFVNPVCVTVIREKK